MQNIETESERAWREFEEARKALLNAFLETKPGRFLIWLLDALARLLK